MHTTNPTLLTSPAFLEHIDSSSFGRNLNQVAEIIHEIQFLTKDKEAQLESTAGLKKEIENTIVRRGIER